MRKRVLSIALAVCLALTLLPTAALAANVITPTANTWEALTAAFGTAQNGDTVRLTGDITTGTGILQCISLKKAVTLDFSGHTIHYNAVGIDMNGRSGLFRLGSGGILTLKGSGGVALTGNYSSLAEVNSGGKLIVESGAYMNTGATDGTLITSYGGAVEIKGGTLNTKSYQALALTGGTSNISGGEVSSSSYALVSFGTAVTLSGGEVSSNNGITAYVTAGGSLNMIGGTIRNTASGTALHLQAEAGACSVSGGEIKTLGGYAVASYGRLAITSDAEIGATSGAGVYSGGALTINGGSIASSSGVALINNGSLNMTGGNVLSDSSYGLLNTAPSGKSASVSGGSITSGSSLPAVNYEDGALSISGGSVTTANGTCAVFNKAAGTVDITGGTLSAKTATIINNGAGTVKFSAGTIASIVNFHAGGRVVIDGGSIKTIEGATPKNSAGTGLRQYPIQITGKPNTPIAEGELTFTPAVTYSFAGVKTDANGTVYLWLPENETSAVYQTGNEDALNGGLAGAGNMTVLPNFVATVTLYLDNEVWTNTNRSILLSESYESGFGFGPSKSILPDGQTVKNGVCTFSGLDEGKTYYVWAPDIIGYSCLGTAEADKLTTSNLSTRVDYYNITLAKGAGIADTYVPFPLLRKGSSTSISATLEAGYHFKNWVDSDTNSVFSTDKEARVDNVAGPVELTAVAELNLYDATVTVSKDNAAWADSGKSIALSPSDTDVAAEGAKSGSETDATVGFTGLDPRLTYYVWADDIYTGQTITESSTSAALDYYTITVTKSANIATASINGSGDSLTVLKGGSATVEAAANANKIFSRWQTADGALYSTTAETTITNISTPIQLTAVGAVDKYNVTVSVNLDGANNWTAQGKAPHKLVLSTSAIECGAINGSFDVASAKYTFSKLSGSGVYYLWDADTLQLVSATPITDTANSATADYYTVTVTNNDTTNITAVKGSGVYLKGSDVTITAMPAQHYRALWDGEATGLNTHEISNISAAKTIVVTPEKAMYTGTITLKLDSSPYTGQTVTLKAEGEDAIATTEASGVYSSVSQLDPAKTYQLLVGGAGTGTTLTGSVSSAMLQYYTVSVTAEGVTGVAETTIVQSGKDIAFTAVPSGGYDFIGWYEGSALLSTNAAFSLSGVSKAYALTARGSNTFDAVVTVNGTSGRTITLQSGSDSAVSSLTGLDRAKTYKVLDNGVDTGFTVSKNSPSVTLQYYKVTLEKNSGIDGVNGGGDYLAGSSATITATPSSNHTFSGWSNGSSIVSSAATYTIGGISENITLIATASAQYTGDAIRIENGNITIADDGGGKIAIIQDGKDPLTGIAPNSHITLTGEIDANDIGVTVSATCGVYLILDQLKITNVTQTHTWVNTFIIISTSGTVVLDLKGDNILFTAGTIAGLPGLKKTGDAELVIQSGSGDGSLTATGNYAPGISGNVVTYSTADPITNFTLNSGTVTCFGNSWNGMYPNNSPKENLYANLTMNGGNITSNSFVGSLVVNGGNIKTDAPISGVKNGRDIAVTQKVYDYTTDMNITDSHGDAYGMTGVTGIDGKVYAYLDQNGYYGVATPSSVTVDGVTATASVSQSKFVQSGSAVTVTVSLSGTALKSGTYTVGLSGASPSTITPATATKNVAAGDTTKDTCTFTFTMPAADVSDLTVSLDFVESAKYTLRYSAPDAAGGSVPIGGSYYAGQNFNVAGNTGSLTRTGYSFSGWSLDGTNTAGGSWSMPAENVNYTALWTADTYTLTFRNGGGTGSDSTQSFTYGTAQALTPNAFTRAGYDFAGWSATSGGAKLYNDGVSVTVAKDTALYALWTPKGYTVSFSSNGGTGAMGNQSFTHDTEQELTPNAFAREGYTFSRWKDGSSNSYLNGASITATGDMVLTAQWTPIRYSVKFDANGGTGSISNQPFTYGTAQNLTVNSMTRTGHSFAGWNTKANGTGTLYGDGANVTGLTVVNGTTVTLYAQWTENSYTVRFDANGGIGSMADQQHSYNAAQTLTPNAFTKTGYSFAGWNTKSNGSGTSYAGGASVKNLSAVKDETVTLYAMWTADAYTLSFAANGGAGSMPSQCFATGDTASLRANAFSKAGHSFTVWKDDKNNSVAENTTVDTIGRSTTLTAQWTANSYTVRFHANGGTGSISEQSFTYDVPQNLTANNSSITRSGYNFAGWSETPTAAAATYTDNQSVSNLTSIKDSSVILYAVWTTNTYAVTFNANGGAGLMADLSITSGESATLGTSVLTRAGYKFSGWNTSADGTGTYYPDGATVSFTPDATGMVPLYAMWTEAVRYNISGTVTNETPAAVSGAALTLRQGNIVIASAVANASGAYVMTNILPGSYNLVTTKDGKTVTTLVTVAQADVTENITLPTAATRSSVLVVDNDAGETAPSVVVGGLESVAQAVNDSITMTVTAKAEDESNVQQSAIKAAVGSGQQTQFLDITLKKGTEDIGDSNDIVLQIVQPFVFSGKTGVNVWRYHGGSSEELTKLESKPSAPFTDATFFADSQNGLIYVYAAKFSAYAVSYQQVVPPSGSGTTSFSITVNASENGTVKADKTSAVSGDKVTVAVAPNTGYAIKSLSVTDTSGKSIALADHKNGTFTFTMPNSNVTVSARFDKQSGNPFIDVADHAYYYDAVLWAVGKGITNGTSATTFSPDGICTRAQTVTFLWRAMGSPEPDDASCPFTDVSQDAYYYKAVLWAAEKGITIGTSSTTFSPNDTVTRGQTVAFLWRTADKPVVNTANPFGDVKNDDYYANAVLWAVSDGITTGTGTSTFSPIDGCTRAQIVTFLYRYLSK